MRTIVVELPESVARDFVAPDVADAWSQQRRADATRDLQELVKDALAKAAR